MLNKCYKKKQPIIYGTKMTSIIRDTKKNVWLIVKKCIMRTVQKSIMVHTIAYLFIFLIIPASTPDLGHMNFYCSINYNILITIT